MGLEGQSDKTWQVDMYSSVVVPSSRNTLAYGIRMQNCKLYLCKKRKEGGGATADSVVQ